jgi:hypothetical protein
MDGGGENSSLPVAAFVFFVCATLARRKAKSLAEIIHNSTTSESRGNFSTVLFFLSFCVHSLLNR